MTVQAAVAETVIHAPTPASQDLGAVADEPVGDDGPEAGHGRRLGHQAAEDG